MDTDGLEEHPGIDDEHLKMSVESAIPLPGPAEIHSTQDFLFQRSPSGAVEKKDTAPEPSGG